MGEWFIEDLHSTRGTRVNGRRLDAGEMVSIVPGAVGVGPDGSVYLVRTGADALVRLPPDGPHQLLVGPDVAGRGNTYNGARGIALDAQGNIYLPFTRTGQVVKVVPPPLAK